MRDGDELSGVIEERCELGKRVCVNSSHIVTDV